MGPPGLRRPAGGVAVTLLSTGLLVTVLAPFRGEIGLINAGFIFLLLTLVIAALWGREVGLFAAILTNLEGFRPGRA